MPGLTRATSRRAAIHPDLPAVEFDYDGRHYEFSHDTLANRSELQRQRTIDRAISNAGDEGSLWVTCHKNRDDTWAFYVSTTGPIAADHVWPEDWTDDEKGI